MYAGIFGDINRVVSKAQKDRDDRRARERGEIPPNSTVLVYETDLESLKANTQKLRETMLALQVESNSYDMQTHQKYKERANSTLNRALLMMVLTEDRYRPEKGKPYSMKLLSRIEDGLRRAMFKDVNPIGVQDIGKPLLPVSGSEHYMVISKHNFVAQTKMKELLTEDDKFFDLSGGDHYFVSDTEHAIERGERMIDELEQKGRNNGLLTD